MSESSDRTAMFRLKKRSISTKNKAIACTSYGRTFRLSLLRSWATQ